ncbi:uncharacterized protein LOC132558914 [Ylistrum balloti]|uniref:uncharacterized protein LOC132558914 n=1 Tax=Ylistrum balloti TaxID=509963 RepID=UPI002905C3C7|nr:uncharacterized protein LOC132558914 [Ylistrum balloti]
MPCLCLQVETSVFMKLRKAGSFNDKLLTDNMTGSYTADTLLKCTSFCASQSLCVSLFFNINNGLCQTHSVVFTDPTSSLVSVNTSYFYITKGNSVLQPIKECDDPPPETGVVWGAGTSFLSSRRPYTCAGALLPKVSDVECHTSGNWTLMSDFCRDLESCEDVQMCSSTNLDGTYQLYPPVLGGHGVNIYCHNMATVPQAYVTLFEENMSRNDYSLRTWTFPCIFQDRVGDATAYFNKISVSLVDMSVNRDDYTFAVTCQESPSRSIPGFGEAGGCSHDYMWRDYRQCPAPGVFVINTNGTGLKISPTCSWSADGAYGSRVEPIEWSSDGLKIQTTFDAWCGSFKPDALYLEYSSSSDIRGIATIPTCPPN